MQQRQSSDPMPEVTPPQSYTSQLSAQERKQRNYEKHHKLKHRSTGASSGECKPLPVFGRATSGDFHASTMHSGDFHASMRSGDFHASMHMEASVHFECSATHKRTPSFTPEVSTDFLIENLEGTWVLEEPSGLQQAWMIEGVLVCAHVDAECRAKIWGRTERGGVLEGRVSHAGVLDLVETLGDAPPTEFSSVSLRPLTLVGQIHRGETVHLVGTKQVPSSLKRKRGGC